MAVSPRPIVVLSAGGEQFGDATMRALELGAVDFIKKAVGIHQSRPRQYPRTSHCALRAQSLSMSRNSAGFLRHARCSHDRGNARAPPAERVVVIASSTGGPRALTEMLPTLPADLPRCCVGRATHAARIHPELCTPLESGVRDAVSEGRDDEPLLAGKCTSLLVALTCALAARCRSSHSNRVKSVSTSGVSFCGLSLRVGCAGVW